MSDIRSRLLIGIPAPGGGLVCRFETYPLDVGVLNRGGFYETTKYGSQAGRCVVEGVDLVGDVVVGVGDGPVGDAGVDEGHPKCLVSQHGGDRFEAHAPVDGLGREGVTELVG